MMRIAIAALLIVASPLAADVKLDAATILAIGQREPVQSYAVVAQDVSQVVGTIPTDWNLKAKMQFLGYASVADAVAERFHCTRGLLERLNPGANMAILKEGDVLNVPEI